MIIRNVRMVNFRVFQDKTIDFHDKPVVLLSAANGIGKTTTIDAIEWCLTGEIGRLKASFDSRSTNDGDRKKNAAGILKNRKAGKNEKVKVELSLFDGEKEIVICRVQQKDVLDPDASTVTINKSEDEADAFIRKYIGDSFYNFHFCDVQKSFKVQSTKRGELKEIFKDFIKNYDAQKQIAANLDDFAEDAERSIEDLEKKKTSQETVKFKEEQLGKAQEGAKQVPYPTTVFYPGEKTDISAMNEEELKAQRKAVRNCGFLVAKAELDKLVGNEAQKAHLSVVRKIASYWETKGESIQRALQIGFARGNDTIAELEQKHKQLKCLSISKDTILQDGTAVIALENDSFTQSDFDAVKKELAEKEKTVAALSSEIDLLSKNNKMLKLLSAISAQKQVLVDYRDSAVAKHGSVKCPVCGSESFADMEAASILKEADEYIRQNGEVVKEKTEEKTTIQGKIDTIYQQLVQRAQNVVEIEREKLADKIEKLKTLKNEVQPYFDAVKSLQKNMQTIQIEEVTAEKAAELLASAEGALLEESQEQAARTGYQQILTVLGYHFDGETLQQTYEKVKNLIIGTHAVSDFSYDLFVSKLIAIDSILANQAAMKLKQELDKIYQNNKELDVKIEELNQLKSKASQRADDIRGIVERLSKEEYEKVGPALSKFYNKLARFNVAGGIRTKLENDGISLVDGSDKNIVNVLSNGQISVFMLAYFFAGINVRNEREKMKVFFIDDLTACMDDVNMLAFIDLLKYQLSTKSTMDQLFFITCDDRISNLLKYKLTGRGIELCELREADFGTASVMQMA